MHTSRRRWSARSTSEPPFQAPWTLKQSHSSGADEGLKSPSEAVELDASSPHGNRHPDTDHGRGRRQQRTHSGDHQPGAENHATVEAGLGNTATKAPGELNLLFLSSLLSVYPVLSHLYLPTSQAPPPLVIAPPTPRTESMHAYPAGPTQPSHTQQTFWIPFTLTPGSSGNAGRLTPINRRVPAHLRAAASSLNIKMTYTRSNSGDYIYAQHTQGGGSTPAMPRTPYNERERTSRVYDDRSTIPIPVAPKLVPKVDTKPEKVDDVQRPQETSAPLPDVSFCFSLSLEPEMTNVF